MTHRIFIVEDHPVMLDAYETVIGLEPDLELCGTAASAEEAITVLVDSDLDCDLIIVDYRLPGLSGADLVRHLRVARPDVPAVVISAHEEETFVHEVMDAGAAAVLQKRDLTETLAPTIRAVLAAHRRAVPRDAA